jgi:hypothetical protein
MESGVCHVSLQRQGEDIAENRVKALLIEQRFQVSRAMNHADDFNAAE